jgi:hypothetical protein
MAKTSAISVRVPDAVKIAAEKAAAEDSRSVASYVEKLLTEHLKAEGYLGGTATSTLGNEPHIAKGGKHEAS